MYGKPYLAGKTYSPQVINVLGEGGENIISDITQPYLKRAFYDKDAQQPALGDLLSSAGNGILLSALLNSVKLPDFKPDDKLGIIHKAYAQELDRQIKQEIEEKSNYLSDNAEYVEKINKDAYNNRRWAVENKGLLTKAEYNRYLKLTTGRITGDENWYITDTSTGDNLIRVGGWIIQSNGDFANAPIKALYKVTDTKFKNRLWRVLYNDSKRGKSIDIETLEYYGRHGLVNRYDKEDYPDYHTLKGRRPDNGKNHKNPGNSKNRTGNIGENSQTLTGYISDYIDDYEEGKDAYYVTLADGKRRRFNRYENKSGLHLRINGRDYQSIKEMLIAENTKILSEKE